MSFRLTSVVSAMSDILSPKDRSIRMSRVRPRGNRSTEQALVAVFRAEGIRGWRRHVRLISGRTRSLPQTTKLRPVVVTPDFIFRACRVAVFVDGCFWHACPLHGTRPVANRRFWAAKLAANRQRDLSTSAALRRAGWIVVRLWEHDLKKRPGFCVRKVRQALARGGCPDC